MTITVNVGPKTGKIPGGLVGKDVDDVEEELREAGFTNVDTKAAKKEDPDTEPNEVLSVSPKSGATAALDGKVTVTYATGKSPVPNFVGVAESAGVATWPRTPVRDAGDRRRAQRPAAPPGTVIRAEPPKADKVVDRTAKIRLVLAEAAPTADHPAAHDPAAVHPGPESPHHPAPRAPPSGWSSASA